MSDERVQRAMEGAMEADLPHRRPTYDAPRLVQLRVETARMVLGQEDATQFCTVHIHDSVGANCAF